MGKEMTLLEVLWMVAAITATALFIATAVVVLLTPVWVLRVQRRDEVVDRDLEARRAQFPDGVLDAAVESKIISGGISPETVQRFIDRGWLNPRPNTKG